MKRIFLSFALIIGATACGISTQQEVQMGQQEAAQINQQLPLVTDPEANRYINLLGDQIASRTSRGDLDWRFYIVDSREVNAFAVPGGFIYVNRGLIEATTRADELAGVLGHEIGHVIQRHSVKQMQNQQKVGAVAEIACTLTSLCESQLGQAAINIGGTAVIARYSRADELEADSEAVENVLKVNIDPEGIPSLFEVLMEQRKTEPTIVDSWFSTHPLEESRVDHSRLLIARSGADQVSGLMQDLPSYAEFKRRVSMLPEPPRPARQR